MFNMDHFNNGAEQSSIRVQGFCNGAEPKHLEKFEKEVIGLLPKEIEPVHHWDALTAIESAQEAKYQAGKENTWRVCNHVAGYYSSLHTSAQARVSLAIRDGLFNALILIAESVLTIHAD